MTCRGLFDLCIAYSAADRTEDLKQTAEEFKYVLTNVQCNDCYQGSEFSQEGYKAIPIAKTSSKNNFRS